MGIKTFDSIEIRDDLENSVSKIESTVESIANDSVVMSIGDTEGYWNGTSVVSYSGFTCSRIDVDSYYSIGFTLASGASATLFFYDADNGLISSHGTSSGEYNLIVPQNASYAWLNFWNTTINPNGFMFKSKTIHRIDTLEDEVSELEENPAYKTEIESLLYDNVTISNGDTVGYWNGSNVVAQSGFTCGKFEGISYLHSVSFTLLRGAMACVWFYDSLGNLISSGGASSGSHRIEVPENADYMWLNFWDSSFISDGISFKSNTVNRIDELENTGTNLKDHFPVINYGRLLEEKCPTFFNAFVDRQKDVTVCITGTSLSQGNLYTPTRPDKSTRPPLLWGYDMASNMFDVFAKYWDGQKYRLYDNDELAYSSSSWTVTNDLKDNGLSVWDDEGSDHNGLTKTTRDAGAYVQTVVPSDAWQFNFIYRTDSLGSNCSVSITEGNGKMEVYNGSSWVEANGYQFTMLEPAATSTKGNTIYQKRLKMRCKDKADGGINSIGETKTIRISKTATGTETFNVVGFEWTPREFMFTLINASRGSHHWGEISGNNLNLELYQDGDIWEFSPDLILCEVTVINWSGSTTFGMAADPYYFANTARAAYFDQYRVDSIYMKSNKYTDCDIVFYGDTASVYYDVWNADGSPKFGLVQYSDGRYHAPDNFKGDYKTIFENWWITDRYMLSQDYIFLPVLSIFKTVCEEVYGSYNAGFQASGENGATLSIDKTHLNKNGAALLTSIIAPLFEFIW